VPPDGDVLTANDSAKLYASSFEPPVRALPDGCRL